MKLLPRQHTHMLPCSGKTTVSLFRYCRGIPPVPLFECHLFVYTVALSWTESSWEQEKSLYLLSSCYLPLDFLFSSHYHLARIVLLSPFCRWGNWGSEFTRVTCLSVAEPESEPQTASWKPTFFLLHHAPIALFISKSPALNMVSRTQEIFNEFLK